MVTLYHVESQIHLINNTYILEFKIKKKILIKLKFFIICFKKNYVTLISRFYENKYE